MLSADASKFRCRATGVQDQGRRFAAGQGRRAHPARRVVVQVQTSTRIQLDLDQLPARRQGLARRRRLAWRHKQEPRTSVLEIEPELVLFICGVEGAADADHRGGQEKEDGLGAVLEHGRYTIARLNPVRRERDRDLFGQLAQPAVSQRRTVRDDQRRFVSRTTVKERADIGVDRSIVVDQLYPLTLASL